MSKSNFLIYGSYGYSGNLIAELACRKGLKPVLAGRNKDKLIEQADRLHLDYRHFDVADLDATKNNLREFIAVVHCAGPFIKTYQNMVTACLATQTHYLDITGEYNVIENLMQLNNEALAAKIMVLPGAGFDVVPSDCLAQYLKQKLPDANQLTLAIHALQNATDSGLSISQGTARTFIEGLSGGPMIRDNGRLKHIPYAWKTQKIDFGNNKLINCTTIAWGDLASAWWSTRIPHIETYMSTPKKMWLFQKIMNPFKFIFSWEIIKKLITQMIEKSPPGPGAEELKNSTTSVYGEVKNASGKKVAALTHTPNGYAFTALSVVLIINKVLGDNAPSGFQTPSTAYGEDLVLEIEGVTREDVID